jgi:hypothetical protein
MWSQYRKTFWKMQLVISMVTVAVYFGLGHMLSRAAVFWGVMQISAVIGAVWALRVKAWANRAAVKLPLER